MRTSKVAGYSLPPEMHEQIADQAKRRGWNKSMVVQEAVRFFVRAYPIPAPDALESASTRETVRS